MRPLASKLFAAGLCTGIGACTYYTKAYNQQIHKPVPQTNIFDESKLSVHFKDYIKNNRLQVPFFCDKYQKDGFYRSFLEQTIIKDMKGLDYYNIYLDRSYQDVLMEKENISEEERLEMHNKAKLYCIFIPNQNVVNNYGMVHSGFVSTLYDSLGAYLTLMVGGFVPPVTAYLNVNYHKPMEVGQEYVSVIEIEKINGRKVFVRAKSCDKDGNVYNSMESLYVKTKFDNLLVKEMLKVWTGLRGQQLLKRFYKKDEEKQLQW